MYTVKFIRAGQRGKDYNFKARGAFTKKFRTLSEVAGYVTSSTDLFFAEPWCKWKGVTPWEKHILKMKLRSILDKRYERSQSEQTKDNTPKPSDVIYGEGDRVIGVCVTVNTETDHTKTKHKR